MTDGITIRALTTQAEYDACVDLQHDTWGAEFADVVPASLQQVSQRLGEIGRAHV